MKSFDDEDLIAHYLHELPPRKASALESALQTDPALAARYEAYATMLRAFKAGAATMDFDEEVMARNWSALQPSLASSGVRPVRPFRWRYPALAGAGLALAATALFVATRPHDATSRNHSSSLRESGGTALSTPPSESASASGGPVGAQVLEEQGPARERGRAGRPFPHLLTSTPQDLPNAAPQTLRLRMIAPLPLSTADATVPHFIPLASASMPAQPVLLPTFVTVGPTGPAQTVAPQARSKSGHSHTSVHHDYPTDLTFAMGGTLIGTREASGTGTVVHTLGATHAVSALAAFHQQLRPAVGYRVAVSYTRPDFQYGLRDATTNSGQQDINGRIYELAATYVVQGPHRGGLSTSVEAGGGLMTILPTLPGTDTSHNVRGTGVAGIAADYALTKHLGIHLAYRAQVFKGPDFNAGATDKFVAGTTFLSNEPMVGITYRFHSK
jgi:hypothetical protein